MLVCSYRLILVRACCLHGVDLHLAAQILLATRLTRLFGVTANQVKCLRFLISHWVCLWEASTTTSLEMGIIQEVDSRSCAVLFIPDVNGSVVDGFKFGLKVLNRS
jgi:hypothetical protein